MRRYRNSALRQRRLCPFSYQRTYLLGDPGLPSPSLEGGRAIHAVAAEVVRAILAGGPIDVHEIAFRIVRGGDIEYADALGVATRLQESIGVEFDIDPEGVFLLEEELEMPITLPSGDVVTFFGTPDLAERVSRTVCRITDYKTHWHPETKAEFAADPQLDRYALLIHEQYPAFETFELIKRFVRYRGNSLTRTISVDNLVGIRLALESEIATTEALDKLLKRLPEGLVRATEAAITHSQGARFAFRRTQPTKAPAAEAAAVTGELF